MTSAQPFAPDVDGAPYLDDDGLLRLGDRWTPIPDSQLHIARMFLEQPMRIVRIEDIAREYASAGGTGDRPAVRSMLTRLAARFRRVGLELVSVRSRGMVLDWTPSRTAPSPSPSPPSSSSSPSSSLSWASSAAPSASAPSGEDG